MTRTRIDIWLIVAWATMLALFGMMAFSAIAHAHEWYDAECCDVRDCSPLPDDAVQITPQGYVTPDGQVIPFADARVSADRQYHWCKYQPDSTKVIWPYQKRACFYAPVGGV